MLPHKKIESALQNAVRQILPDADVKVTRDLIRGGQLLKMEVLDHVIVGNGNFSSLRSLGHFYQ